MSQKTITYNDFQDQSEKIANYLDSQYWEIDSNEKTATMKPRFSNLPNEVKVSGLSTADTRHLKFDGNSISLGSGAASSVTISGNNFEHQKTTVYVTSKTDVEISTSDICFNGGNYDNISLSSGAADCTIYGGQGQDTIYNNDPDNGHVIQIKNGDGHKVLRGYTAKDSIQIMDDSTFTPTVFSPANNTDYFPVQIGNTQVSLQGNLLQVPCVKFLDKNGDLISSNTAGNGVIFKSPDVVIENSGLSTSVQGCNCSVTGTSGSDSIFTAYGGVTIDSIFENGADYICNTNTSEYGNTYAFKTSVNGGNFTSSIVGYNHEVDTLIIERTVPISWIWQDTTVSVSADDGACNTVDLGKVLLYNTKRSGSFKITTQSAFYDEVFTYTRIDNGGAASIVALPVVHTYSVNAPLTNEHFKNLNSTSTANLVSKRPEAVITHKGNWTILPEGSGSTITCAGTANNFLCHANNCSVQGSATAENYTVDGNNNTLMTAGGADTISLVSGSVNNICGFAANSNAVIYGNGEGNVFQILPQKGSATVHNFNKNKDFLSYYPINFYSISFVAVSGGYSINFLVNSTRTFTITLLGALASGDVIKCKKPESGELFSITIS